MYVILCLVIMLYFLHNCGKIVSTLHNIQTTYDITTGNTSHNNTSHKNKQNCAIITFVKNMTAIYEEMLVQHTLLVKHI